MNFESRDGGSRYVVSTGGNGTVSDLQSLVNDSSVLIIEFESGTYDFTGGIDIARPDFQFRGIAGQNVTLNYTGSAGSTLEVRSQSPLPPPDYTLHAAAAKETTTVRIAYDAADPLQAGDTLYFSQPNDLTYIDDDAASEPLRWIAPDNGNDGVPDAGHLHDDENGDGILDAGENHFPENGERLREFHTVIVGDGIDNDGNGIIDDEATLDAVDEGGDGTYDYWEIVLADETPYAFTTAAGVVRATDLVADVSISNLKFTYSNPTLLAVDDYYTDPATE